MKKRFYLCFVIILILVSFFVSFASSLDEESFKENVEGTREKVEDIKQYTEKDKWVEIGEKWKGNLRKNRIVSFIDDSFEKLDKAYLFLFILNKNYELSFDFFFALFVYLFFLYAFVMIFKEILPIRKSFSILIAIAVTVILAHFKVYNFISLIALRVIFYKSGVWGFVFSILVGLLYVILFILMKKIVDVISSGAEAVGEGKSKKRLDERVKKTEKFVSGIEEEMQGN